MKKILINATQDEELRVALVENQLLINLDIEHAGLEQKKANIYKGAITRIEPSLEAAFINYGAERQGFLPLKEIAPSYYKSQTAENEQRPSIKDVLQVGQELIVQIDKEERGNKGAALTTLISLAGCYLVLMPNNSRATGISRRIEGEERTALREALDQLTCPDNMGIIARTAAIGRSIDELQWDLDILLKQWEAISSSHTSKPAPLLIRQEGDIITRTIRDHLRPDIDEIVIDSPEVFTTAKEQIKLVRPDFISKVKPYKNVTPLFTRYQIEKQIDSVHQREVSLPSGGVVVFDRTEALTAIDINSAKATRGEDIEETALHTNLEAAREIARQCVLRDLGGLIVIDFIDMTPIRHQRQVENEMRSALKNDRARVQIGRISRFGLLEMSRQRLRPSLADSTLLTCPRCNGQGAIRDAKSLALSIIRLIEEEALKNKRQKNTNFQIRAQVPVEISSFILNEKRNMLADIEKQYQSTVLIVPNKYLETPHYTIENNAISNEQANIASYELVQIPTQSPQSMVSTKSSEPSAVDSTTDEVSGSVAKEEGGFIKRLFSGLFGSSTSEEQPAEAMTTTNKVRNKNPKNQPRRRSRSNTNNRDRDTKQNRGEKGRNTNNPRPRKTNSGNPSNRSNNKHEKSQATTAKVKATTEKLQESTVKPITGSSPNQTAEVKIAAPQPVVAEVTQPEVIRVNAEPAPAPVEQKAVKEEASSAETAAKATNKPRRGPGKRLRRVYTQKDDNSSNASENPSIPNKSSEKQEN